MEQSNVVQFPIVARPTAWPTRNFKITIVRKGGQRIEQFERTYLASMDLVRIALQEYPDAIRVAVIKQS